MTQDKRPKRSGKGRASASDSKPKNGLGARRRQAVAVRPARPSARAAKPLAKANPKAFEALSIERHRDLAGRQREIFRRLNRSPDAALLMLINPVLAMNEIGVSFSPQMRDHVLRALQHPPRVAARRTALEKKLEKALGEPPRPNDSKWLASTVFGALEVGAKVTRGRTPAYTPPVTQPMLDRLSRRRPAATFKRAPPPRRRQSKILLKPWQPAIRRLDLDATVPELPLAKTTPKTLKLETLAFYKDDHPLARDLLELGILAQRSFPIQTAASYRDIRAGKKANSFRAWIRRVEFKSEP